MYWGAGDDVEVTLSLSSVQWARISAGDALQIAGAGYLYEGEHFQDDWYFNESEPESLRITYTDDDGDEGDGYIGTIADAELRQKACEKPGD